MRPSPRQLIYGGILASLIIVAGSGAASFFCIRDLIEAEAQAAHTDRILDEIDRTVSSLRDSQFRAEGFALSGDEGHLDHYRRDCATIGAQIAELRRLMEEDPEQSRRLESVIPLIQRRMEGSDRLIESRRKGGIGAAVEFAAVNCERLAMEEIITATDVLRGRGKEILVRRRESLETSTVRATGIVLAGALLALALMGRAGFLIVRHAREQQREAGVQAERARLAEFAAEIASLITRKHGVDGVLQGCAEAMAVHLDAAAARLWRLSARDGALELGGCSGLETEPADSRPPLPTGNGEAGLIARDRQPYVTNDYPHDPRTSDPAWARRSGIVAFAGYPLIAGDRLIGVLAMYSRRPCGELTLRALATAAASVALEIERRRVESVLVKSEFKARAIFETASDGLITIDQEGTIEEVNAVAERMFGYDPDEMLGKDIGILMPEPERGKHREHVERYIRSGRRTVSWQRREITALRKDGTPLPVELSISEVTMGDRRIFAGTFRDISERRAVQKALLLAQKNSETGSRAKSEFLSNMSHELRTPLNSVIGFANILLKNKSGDLKPQELQYLARILDNGRHLLRLINEVLDLTKIEAGRMDLVLTSVRLDLLIREVLAQMESQVRERDVILDAVIPLRVAPITSDADKLKQCLINLVSNAIKFAEHGRVTVRLIVEDLTFVPRSIEVQDSGIGITPDRQAAIFEAFHQGDNTTARRYGGTGLGLTITRSFLHLLGHTIDVVSEPGRGSVFRMNFAPYREATRRFSPRPPASLLTREPPSRAGTAPPETPRIPTGKTVLIIEDDGDALLLLSEYLEQAGCTVLAAARGGPGLVAAREARPDLILLDLLMPGMDGWEVLRLLKTDPLLRSIPVAIVSVVATDRQGLADGVLKKPVTLEAVRELLERVFTTPRTVEAIAPEAGAPWDSTRGDD
ncbi:MAG: PAS domain S-box protein [Planctomycetes bacterium]|nr:PAS domain S-box protein [Planctomycetota bacterium]